MTTYPEGSTALITGGASGIGAACAKLLANSGVRVITADISGGDVHLDVTDNAAVDALSRRLGRVDILINSAGIIGPSAPVVDIELEAWQRTFRINVDGTFLMCRAFVPAMVDHGWGRVINLASVAAKDGNPLLSAYAASKAAVIAMTKSLGKECATTGVLANAIAPAVIESPMNAATDPAVISRSRSLTPMARLGRPEEVAELAAWLSSNELSFSTGAVYDISGGRASY